MKSVVFSVLVFISVVASVISKEQGLPSLDIGKSAQGDLLDMKLMRIANDPNLIKLLDQENNFNKKDVYIEVRSQSMEAMSKILPKVFGIDDKEGIEVSVCVADSRTYFWRTLDRYVVFGFIPLEGFDGSPKKENEVFFWVLLKENSEGDFAEQWRNNVKDKSQAAILDLVDNSMGIEIANPMMDDVGVVTGDIVVGGEDLSVKLCVSGNVLQSVVKVTNDSKSSYMSKLSLRESKLNNLPIVLPFWPD